ncbi:hypothetical protein V8C42DRAFT_306980 [Trichoderma barbatum]
MLRCAMPPRQCRVIAVARCHDLPRDLALVRKRHRTVGESENVPASTNQDLGVSPLGLWYSYQQQKPDLVVYSTKYKPRTGTSNNSGEALFQLLLRNTVPLLRSTIASQQQHDGERDLRVRGKEGK